MGLFDSIRRTLGGGDDSSTDASSDSSTDDGPAVTDSTSLSPTDFRKRAETVADRAEKLDFTVESLARLDRAVAEQYDGETVAEDGDGTAYTTNTVRFGSYLGEVLVRDLNGRWVRDDGWGVTVAGQDGELTVAVFDVAARSFADEPVFAAVVDRLEAELSLDRGETDTAAADSSDDADETDAVTDETGSATEETNTDTAADETQASDDGWGEVTDDWQPATETTDSETSLSDLGSVADTPDTANTTTADDTDEDDGFVIPDAEGGVAAGGDSADAAGEGSVDTTGREQSGDVSPEPSAGDSSTQSADTETATADTGTVSGSPEPDTGTTPETADDGETTDPDGWSLAGEDDGADSAWPPDPETAEEPTASPDDDPTVGDGLRAERAQAATDFAAFWGEHDLDFTPASLERLDVLVDAEWDEERFADATFGETERFEDQSFTNLVGELGSYFGEVLVRELDGEWTEDTDHEAAVVVSGTDGRLAVPVYQVAITSLRGAAAFDQSYRALLADLSAADG